MKTKHSLFTSIVALVLCVAMLAGTTFAWFTDAVSSKSNIIQSGNLDITMEWANDFNATTWNDATTGAIFTHDNWEPGYTDVKYIKITNAGNLNLKWRLTLEAEGTVTKLSDVIGVYCVNPATGNLTSIDGLTPAGMLTNVLNNKDVFAPTGALARGEEVIVAIAMHMDEEAGNTYQGLSLCNAGFSVKLVATQNVGEHDSFGDDYDNDAEWPEFKMDFEEIKSLAGISTTYDALATDVTIRHKSGAYAIVPAGTKLAAGATELKFTGKNVESNGNFADTAKSYDIHIEGIAADNDQCITVFLGKILEPGLGATALKLYHESTQMTRVNSVSDFASPDQYTYDEETGAVTIYVKNFSVFSAVQTSADVWDGTSDTSWYNTTDTEFTLTTAEQLAGFRDIVDGKADGIEYDSFANKTVKLGADIDLNNKLFNPIGGGWAYNGGNTFNGTFDGGNHTIYNIYVNGWELDGTGDKHSGTSMGAGLFSSIHNATIQNLAICGAELVVETTSIGVVVGCAQGQCTFENIIVSNATLGNYQMRNGGIVGDIYVIASDNVPEGEFSHTFTNIVVDSTVKLCSMWGDFDTGNGGVIGGKYGSAKVLMQNVVVAAELDVFSDVTAAYQWYAYRRCGMLVGYTGQNSPKQATNAAADFLTCENVTVYYGDWVNYTYYQFANQTDAEGNRLWNSNYPWVRAEESDYNGPFSNVRYGNPIINGDKINTLELAEANKTTKTTITFNQLYGGGQGVYGCANHKQGGVTTRELGASKTVYIFDDEELENLGLKYWFANGDDTWTTVVESIPLENYKVPNYNVFVLNLPAFVDSFTITVGDKEKTTFDFADLENNGIYTVDGEAHEHNYTDGKCDCGAYKTKVWQLVEDVNDLAINDQIIIVEVDAEYAIGTSQATNNRPGVAIVKNGNGTITISENVQVLTLVEGTTDGTFGFYTGSGYLYAAATGSNHLKTQATNNKNGDWTITITDGVASIVAKGSSNRNVMQYNPNNGSPIFSCYASASQKAIAIYKLTLSEGQVAPHNCLEYATGADCEDNATCTKCAQEVPNTALGHNYESVVTEPRCIEGGYTTHTCSRCEHQYKDNEVNALGHTTTDGVCERCKQTIGETAPAWTLVTDASKLQLGDQIVIVAKDSNVALSTTQNNNNRGQATVVKDGDTVKFDNTVQTLTLKAGTVDGTFAFYTGSGYLYAASSSSNHLKTQTTNNDNGSWKITITDGIATIKAQGNNTNNWLKYNNTSSLFSCYGSGQKDVVIYKLVGGSEGGDTPACEHTNTTIDTTATCTEAGVKTVTCNDCKTTISNENVPALGHTTESGTCTRCKEEIGGNQGGSTEPVTESKTIYANQGSLSNKVITWTGDNFTFSNAQASSTTAIRTSDSDHFRVYAKSTVTIEAKGKKITQVVITCTSSDYANVMKTSATNADYTATVSGSVVTITVNNAESITFTASAQTRLNKVEVTYTA